MPKSREHLKPVPVRMSARLLAKIREGAEHLSMSDQDTFRLSCEIGLAALAAVDHDVPEIIARFALEKTTPTKPNTVARVGFRGTRGAHQVVGGEEKPA